MLFREDLSVAPTQTTAQTLTVNGPVGSFAGVTLTVDGLAVDPSLYTFTTDVSAKQVTLTLALALTGTVQAHVVYTPDLASSTATLGATPEVTLRLKSAFTGPASVVIAYPVALESSAFTVSQVTVDGKQKTLVTLSSALDSANAPATVEVRYDARGYVSDSGTPTQDTFMAAPTQVTDVSDVFVYGSSSTFTLSKQLNTGDPDIKVLADGMELGTGAYANTTFTSSSSNNTVTVDLGSSPNAGIPDHFLPWDGLQTDEDASFCWFSERDGRWSCCHGGSICL